MSTFLKIHELIKSAALFTLCALSFLFAAPVYADTLFNGDAANQAAQGSDVADAYMKTLSSIGLGVLEGYGILIFIILALAFMDGSARNRDRRESENQNAGKSEDSAPRE